MASSPTLSKQCQRCGEICLTTEFYVNRRRVDGLQAWCKTCIKAYAATGAGVPEGQRQRVARGSRVTASTQTCTKCREVKPREAFALRPSGSAKSQCRICWNAWRSAHRASNAPTTRKEYGERNIRRRMPVAEYTELLESQDGVCAICRGPATGRGRLHIDHDHGSGEIRGLLCHGCNTGLGSFSDDPLRMLEAVRYLLDHGHSLGALASPSSNCDGGNLLALLGGSSHR